MEAIRIKSVIRNTTGEQVEQVYTQEYGTLALSSKVKGFFKPWENHIYSVRIEDDTIVFVDFEESNRLQKTEEEAQKKESKKEEPKKEEPKEEKTKTQEPKKQGTGEFGGTIKDKQILAQSTMRHATELAIARNGSETSVEDIFEIHDQLMEGLIKRYF